jgi:NhaA family Na+:H+ antiporter
VLPAGVPLRLVWGLAALAGIGFTVSLFITDLAYTDPVLLIRDKVGIFAASAAAALLGCGLLLALTRGRTAHSPASDPDAAPAGRPGGATRSGGDG